MLDGNGWGVAERGNERETDRETDRERDVQAHR